MNTQLPVSVCLVTYNRSSLLPKTLDSILAQSFSDYELLISDDCSTDETATVCADYVKRDDRVHYLTNPTNLGMPGNLNACLAAAKGEYVAILHDGDIYHPELFSKWKGALDACPSAGFVFNEYLTRDGPGVRVFKEPYPSLIKGHDLARRLLSGWGSCVYGTVMARRNLCESLGLFDPRFGFYSDVDMWLKLARDHDVAYVKEPLIELMPKDPMRFWAFVHWQVNFWLMAIHTTNLVRYRAVLPELVQELSGIYRHRRRRFLARAMLTCLKHRRWDRMREGLAIWRDADDGLLRTIGIVFGRSSDRPSWYGPAHWDMARYPR